MLFDLLFGVLILRNSMNYCKYNKVAVERTLVYKTTNCKIITNLMLSVCTL